MRIALGPKGIAAAKGSRRRSDAGRAAQRARWMRARSAADAAAKPSPLRLPRATMSPAAPARARKVGR
eukprot:4696995-Alexandrium_andersonii.AAC.1